MVGLSYNMTGGYIVTFLLHTFYITFHTYFSLTFIYFLSSSLYFIEMKILRESWVIFKNLS